MYVNGERVMAYVAMIEEKKAIEGADHIEAYRIDGWWVVDKKDQYQVGDLVVYCEVDSWIPHDLAPFLSKGKEPRIFKGVVGERLRTVRLKGQLSQGLLLPFTETLADYAKDFDDEGQPFWMGPEDFFQEGQDVSEVLGIQKWEAPIPAQLAGQMRGNFPSAVKKTDADRVQNLNRSIEQWKQAEYTFTVMEKIDGSSSTFYLDQENDFHVCSRNWDLKDEGENTYWNMAKKYSIQEKMIANNMQGLAIQGETFGFGLNGNLYKMQIQDLMVFSIYDTKTSSYLPTMEAKKIADVLGLNFVPIIGQCNDLLSIDEMLSLAEFKSNLNHSVDAEGHVYRCNEDPNISFKAISNTYLIKKKE